MIFLYTTGKLSNRLGNIEFWNIVQVFAKAELITWECSCTKFVKYRSIANQCEDRKKTVYFLCLFDMYFVYGIILTPL